MNNKTIWIIGASSGIGYELAIGLAQLGATLILSARRSAELKKLQRKLGKGHHVLPLDIADGKQVEKIHKKIKGQLDSVIVMSSVYCPNPISKMDAAFASKMVDVNLKGALNVTHSVLPIFERQQSGQIVFCGSVAGYMGLPNGQPYSATKAAIINFAESLYAEAPDYLDVKLISPGFVRTPMTQKNTFNMPMIISAQTAASIIIEGLSKKHFEIHFPKRFSWLVKLLSMLPYRVAFFITKKRLKNQ